MYVLVFLWCVWKRGLLLVVCHFFPFLFSSFLVPVSRGYFLYIYFNLLAISLSDLHEDECKCAGVGACVGVHVCACISMICVWRVWGGGECIVHIFSIFFLSNTSITWLFLVYLFKHVISLTERNL